MPFTCQRCLRVFRLEGRLRLHKCSYCRLCSKLFSTYQRFYTHKCVPLPSASSTSVHDEPGTSGTFGTFVHDESLTLTLKEIERQKQFQKLKDARKITERENKQAQRNQENDKAKEERKKRNRERTQAQRSHETDEDKEERKKRNRERTQAQRSHETDKDKEERKKRDRERTQAQRSHETDEDKEERKKRNRERTQAERSHETDKDKEERKKRDRERTQAQRSHETDKDKEERKKRDRERTQAQRSHETDEDKEERKKRDRERTQAQRSHETDEDKEERKKRNRERTQAERSHETDKDKEERKKRDRERTQAQRNQEMDEAREERKKRDKDRRHQVRNPGTIEFARTSFFKEILKSPEYVCTVCHRCMYKESVSEMKLECYRESALVNKCRTGHISVGREWICNTCKRHLIKGNIPQQAQVNKMFLPDDPCVLDDLTDFEARLISKRIPFMKITALPRGKQKGIVGSVINVPSDVDETCQNLPRTPASAGIIPIKLKRKQEYKSHVFYEHVRPHKVIEGFEWLKKNNPHYHHVIDGSEHWEQTSTAEDKELWDHLTLPEAPDNAKEDSDKTKDKESINDNAIHQDLHGSQDSNAPVDQTSTAEDIDFHAPQDSNAPVDQTSTAEDQDSNAPVDHPLDTCVQRSDIALDVSNVITFSPGEGKVPVGLMMDPGCEEMAFPKLFPTGQFGFDVQRDIAITPKKYFNARILNKTGKFAANTEYLFFAQYITEYKQVMDNISIALRKAYSSAQSGEAINSSMIKDSSKMTSLIAKNHAYQFLQTVRGSPPYWQKAMFKLLAAVKQFGIFTFFVTLSSADMKWHDTLLAIARQQGKHFTTQQINEMSYEEKSALLRSNPVTAARHFDHRLQSFFQKFLLSPAQPLGKIRHYSYRIEFQQRGSPHAHMVIWSDDAPKSQEDKDVCDFIDKYVTCRIPSEEDDPELHQLVTTVQQHHHSATCKKKGTFCRFNFPKLPSEETVIAKKPEVEDPEQLSKVKEQSTEILSKVHEALEKEESSGLSVKNLVEQAGISMDKYTAALKVASRGSTVVLQRTPEEKTTNYYNEHLLRAWGANIDVQYCLDPYACITYMVSYITKDEREMSQVLQAISKESSDVNWSQKMKNCAKAFLNAREISSQEAVYRLLSFPLFKCNFRTVFVPADLPQNRVVFLKPLSLIQTLEADEEDIYQKNIIDRYGLRPASLNDMCLAQFAAWYVPVYTSTKNPESDTDDKDDQDATPMKHVVLRDGSGSMRKANSPAVLRYHKVSKEKSPEQFYYSQLLLYLPWTSEKDLLALPSFEDHFNQNLQKIIQNKQEFEHNTEIIENAVQDFETNGPPMHAFDEVSPSVEQERAELEDEGVELDPEAAVILPDPEHSTTGSTTDSLPSKSITYSIEVRPGVISDEDYHSLVRSLNEKQRSVYSHVLSWCSSISKKNRTGVSPDQMCLFVSGGAGTGKSHLISALYQMAVRTLVAEGDNPDDVRVTLAAPTGTAAHNISGVTLHSAFLLPLGQTKSYIRLSDEKRNGLRGKAGKLDLIIIDEISMVSRDVLLQIHNRLSEIKGVNDPFGGVSVIVFGDLFQLPPVLQPFIFRPMLDVFNLLSGSLWRLFRYVELDQIMRQKEDLQFANLLSRIRKGMHTDEDIAFLKSRQIELTDPDYPKECLHVFATNKAVDDHNKKMLDTLDTPKLNFVAVDRKPAALSSYDVNTDSRFTGGLPSVVCLAVGAKVMLIRNIDVTDGLVNGAQGTIVGFSKAGSDVAVVLVIFNDAAVGAKSRSTSRYVTELRKFPRATPIERSEIAFTVHTHKKGLTITRHQFPLKLAWGCTIHKVQGITADKIVISFKKRFTDGQAYVALSRVRSPSSLFLLDFEEKKILTSQCVLEEMSYLAEEKKLDLCNNIFHQTSSIVASVLNIRSLLPHKPDVMQDPVFNHSDIIVLTETWLADHIDSKSLFNPELYNIYRADGQLSSRGIRKACGVLVTVRKPNFCRVLETFVDGHIQMLLVEIIGLQKNEIYLLGMYCSPGTHSLSEKVVSQIKTLLSRLKTHAPCMIMGDVNEDALRMGPVRSALENMGFTQVVQESTHQLGSCLDHIYVNNACCDNSKVTPVYYSDHHWASCQLSN